MKKILLFSLFVTLWFALKLEAEERDSVSFQNQISLLALYNPSNVAKLQLGGLYLPQMDYLRDFSGDKRISAQVSGKFSFNTGFLPVDSHQATDPETSARLYRAWVRFSTQRNEVRLGLQQINFGSATILRPLQWFDGLDPTDPLRMTNGVWGVLDRIYFKNNSTLWLWGLYANRDRRIWDSYSLKTDLPEAGLRFQQPVPGGEMAMSVNHRWLLLNQGLSNENRYTESKIGLDGKWDVGPGIWFENSFTFTSEASPLKQGMNLLTIGADLTPGGLDGLSFTTEHLLGTIYSKDNDLFSTMNLTALTATWPINFFNRMSGIIMYSWESRSLFRYLTWSADFNKSSFYIIGFWNPTISASQLTLGSGSYAGYGLQIMYVIHL